MSSIHPLARRFVAGVTSAVAAVALLAACQPSGGESTPPPSISPILPTTQTGSPTVSGTPSSSSSAPVTPSPSLVVTARPTTPEETAALAAEAEHVYREFRRLVLEYEAAGGLAGPLPDDLRALVAGELAPAVEASLQETHRIGARLKNADRYVITTKGTFGENLEPSALIGLQFCDDGSLVTVVRKDGSTAPGHRFMNWSEFSRSSDGQLRIIYNESRTVTTCDS